MSDLDKAIRDRLGQSSWELSHETSLGARVLLDLLDLHAPEPAYHDEPDGRAVCGHCLASDGGLTDYPCRTVQTISRRFRMSSVSGEAQSEPTTASREPRVWRDQRGELWEDDGDGLLHQTASNGRRKAERPKDSVERHYGPLSEVTTPEGTA